MARARNIKPGLFKNELLGVADPHLTLLFQSLWCLADREGRLEDRPLRIKAETFPYREKLCVNGYLTELQRLGFIVRYKVGDVGVIQVVNFKKHQAPHNTEKASELPDVSKGILVPCGLQGITVNPPLLDGEITEALPPDSLIPDSGYLIPDSGYQIKSIVELAPDLPTEIFQHWQKMMGSPKAVLDAKRKALIIKALKEYPAADLCKAISGCSKSPFNMGQNDRKTKFNSLGLIFRDADRIEHFMSLDSGTAKPSSESIAQMNSRAMSEFLGDEQSDDNTIEMETSWT